MNWNTWAFKTDKDVCNRLKQEEDAESNIRHTYFGIAHQEIKKMKKIWWLAFEGENEYHKAKQEWIQHMKEEGRTIYIPSFIDKPEMDTTKKYEYTLDITFPEEMQMEEKIECIEETYKEASKHTEDIIACIEQRGHNDDTLGNGIHSHANITTDSSTTLDKFYPLIKDVLHKYGLKKKNINWKTIKGSYKSVRDRYVRGDKGDAVDKDGVSKMLKVEYDKRMRTHLGLNDTYTIDDLHKIYTENEKMPHSQARRLNVAVNNGITIRHNVSNSLTPFG